MANELIIELCADSGCGLYLAKVEDKQYRISLMPDECLEARALAGDHEKLAELLLRIEASFSNAIDALGIDAIATAISAKPLPQILKKMAGEE